MHRTFIYVIFFGLAANASAAEINFSGDFRYRHEYISQESSIEGSGRHRERLRLRLNALGKVNDDITARLRISTADGASPTSNNATMTDNSAKKPVYIDIASVNWTLFEHGHVVLGKQQNPLRLTELSEMVYDSDYTPEGALFRYMNGVDLRLAGFSIKERGLEASGATEPDSWLLAGLLGYIFEVSDDLVVCAGGGLHAFTSIKNNAALGDFLGNSNSGGRYLNDYEVGEVVIEATFKPSASAQVTAFVDAIQNFRVESDNTGLIAGGRYQTLLDDGKPNWTFGYAYQTLGKDATLSAANNSNLNNNIDGGIGHTLTVGKRLALNANMLLSLRHGKVDNNGDPYSIDRHSLDFSFNF